MIEAFSPTSITSPIQQLLDQRQQHLDALAAIDEKLKQISGILRSGVTVSIGRSNGKKPQAPLAVPKAAGKKKRKVGKFATTGEAFVLSFIQQHKNPTSQEIEKHWKSEGRGGPAANTLSSLTKDKKLKRTPLGKGIRGSRYSLA